MTYTETLQGTEESKEALNMVTKGVVVAAGVIIALLAFALAK